MYKKKILSFGVATFIFTATFFWTGIASHTNALTLNSTTYTNRLIDDFVFRNNTAMNQAQIQSFLQNLGSGLAGFSDTEDCSSNPSYMSQYYSCGQNVPASKIIYDAAQAYGVNPRVILATLQKEQGVVTTPNPTASQLNFAMSYGCPDSTGCTSASYPGFFNQVDWATWQLRLNTELMSGNSYFGLSPSSYACNGTTRYYSQALKPGNDVHFIDDFGVDYNHFVLSTASTASLYCYTPHAYNNPSGLYGLPAYGSGGKYYTGSYNFVYYFTLWWGSTYATDTYTPHPNGTLVSLNGRVYLISSSTKQWITNGDVFTSYGYPWFQVKTGTTGDANLPSGADINTLAPGTIFRTDNSPVYVMNYVSGSLVKQQISYTAFNSLGYTWDQVMYVAPGNVPAATSPGILFANQHPAGTLVSGAGKVFLLDQSTKRWILGPDAFTTNNFSWGAVKPATSLDLGLPDGTPVDLRQGNMLTYNGDIFLVDYDGSGIMKRPVGPWECFASRWHYVPRDLYQVSAGSLPARNGPLSTC